MGAPESQTWDMGLAMYNETYALYGKRANDAHDFQGAATFYDPDGIKYEAQWIYTFYPSRFKQAELNPDDETPRDEREEIGAYLTVSDTTTHPDISGTDSSTPIRNAVNPQ